ncbi:MAG: response regulator transcription factor [Pseudomonadales bacterium]
MSKSSRATIQKLGDDLLQFASTVDQHKTITNVLDNLDAIVSATSEIRLFGALQFPMKYNAWNSVRENESIFLHASVPSGMWEEYRQLGDEHPGPMLALAQLSLAPFTMSEQMQMLQPIGLDRWPYELALKYKIRDFFVCPVGGRWVIAYHSARPFTDWLEQEARAVLLMGATFAAIRIQILAQPNKHRTGNSVSVTPRERAVLRLASLGHTSKEIASRLEIGTETIESHLKKAQQKLGARSRTHTVAAALRLRLIA